MSSAVITVPSFSSVRDGVRHFFGTKAHAERLDFEVGVPARSGRSRRDRWFLSVKQVHGTQALVVDRALKESDRFTEGWDALVTDQPGVTVAVRTADCVPVLVYDRRRKAVAAIHAGWRGAVAGIVSSTLALMQSRFNVNDFDLRIGIGPSAGPCCYEVDEKVLAPLRSGITEWQSLVRDNRGLKAKLDLKALVRRQLEDYGLRPEQISSVNLCTICHGELFYSYRREGRVNGTMVSGIALEATW